MSNATDDSELRAVESAFNTLALTSTDQALARVLDKLLPGLLAALSTKSAPARAKIIEALQHVNIRLRASPSIKLPFEAVLRTVSAESSSLMTRNVGIRGGYVFRCYSRLEPQEKGAAAASLIHAAVRLKGARMDGNREVLLGMALESLRFIVARKGDQKDSVFNDLTMELSQGEVNTLFEFFKKVFGRTAEAKFSDECIAAAVSFCLALSISRDRIYAKKAYPVLLIAAADRRGEVVSSAAEDALRRIGNCKVLCECNSSFLEDIITLFLTHSSVMLRTLILEKVLLPVPRSANYFPPILDVLNVALGREAPGSLRKLGMQFIVHIMENGSSEMIDAFGKNLLDITLEVAKADVGDKTLDSSIRSMGLAALGAVVSRAHEARTQDVLLPEFLFSIAASSMENGEVRASACRALNVIAPKFVHPPTAILSLLRSTLLNATGESSSARHTAVIWSNRCFPFSDPKARLLNIIGSGDERQEIREAAMLGLSPKTFRGPGIMEPSYAKPVEKPTGAAWAAADHEYPEFSVIVGTVAKEINEGSLSLGTRSWHTFMMFSLKCLQATAERCKCADLSKSGPTSLATISNYLRSSKSGEQALVILRGFAKARLLDSALAAHALPERAAVLVILCSAALDPRAIADEYQPHLDTLVRLCELCSARGNGVLVEALAALVGLSSTTLSLSRKRTFTSQLSSGLVRSSGDIPVSSGKEDQRVSKILSLGHCVLQDLHQGPLDHIREGFDRIGCHLSPSVETSSLVRIAACTAIAAIARNHVLPFPVGDIGEVDEIFSAEKSQSKLQWIPTRSRLFLIMCSIARSSKSDSKVVEACCRCLSFASMKEPERKLKELAISVMLNIVSARKEEDLRFSVGEYLVRAATGIDVSLRSYRSGTFFADRVEDFETLISWVQSRGRGTVSEVDAVSARENAYQDDESVARVLDHAIKLCFDEDPKTRTGGCIVLFVMIKSIGTEHFSPPWMRELIRESRASHVQRQVSRKLTEAQFAFSTLLGERCDVTQQLAVEGVTVVYNLSSPKIRADLVHNLVRFLTAEHSSGASSIPGDKGALLDIGVGNGDAGRKQRGGSKTYRELCEIASDVGKPELLYKMMEVAAYSSLWNNRRGAALAGNSLFDHGAASKYLAPHMKKIFPRLYIYSFDPDEKTRQAMLSVLQAIASASQHSTVSETLKAQLQSVIERCLQSIGNHQWRLREAACCALRDAVSGRSWEEINRWVVQIWRAVLRAMDDIKESVRSAGSGCGRAVAGLSLRLSDPNVSGSAIANKAVRTITPILLEMITHSVVDIRNLGSSTLTKLVDVAGSAMKPVLGDTISGLLEAATELEPQALNYIQFHVEEKEALDHIRAQAASRSGSFVMGSLVRLVRLVDQKNVGDVVTRLIHVSRVGLGTATRAVSARLFTTILVSHGPLLKPYCSKLMTAAADATRHESRAHVRKAWASAVAHAAKLAPSSKVQALVGLISNLSASDVVKDREIAAALAASLWSEAPDVARQHASVLLPISFICSHEASDEITNEQQQNWKKVWSSGVASESAGLRMYSSEITELAAQRLETSPRYSIKASAAAALGNMASVFKATNSIEILQKAATSLVSVLPLKMWEGKEKVLSSLAMVAEAAMTHFREERSSIWKDIGGAQEVVRVMLAECNRGKKEYRLAVLHALPKLFDCCRDEVDVLDPMLVRLESAIASEDDGADVDIYNEAESVAARQKDRKASMSTLIGLITATESSYCGDKHSAQLGRMLGLLSSACQGEHSVRLAALKALENIAARSSSSTLTREGILGVLYNTTLEGLNDGKFSKVRRAALGVLSQVFERCSPSSIEIGRLSNRILERLSEMKEKENDAALQIEARRLYESLSRTGHKRSKHKNY